ncbi:complement C4-like [Pristis pectinata]|uniref:complement C4-like n=1 Tax=Pristis pectinata TaxID=685728 RepID=UPI00223E23BF|nr:complement C4-like [Pristis pectinata]
MGRLAVLFWLCVVIPGTEQTKSYLITAPNIIHVGVKESVTVQLDGVDHIINIKVYLLDVISGKKISEDVEFSLSVENNYQQIKDIVALPHLTKQLNIWLRKDKYISLVAECPELFATRKMIPVLLCTRKGYIFIQTDKPIYTPDEDVRYRIYTLDNYMRPVNENIRVTIYNSKNIQFPSLLIQSRKVLTRTFKIPDVTEPGNWRIEAEFDEAPMSKVTSEFEVKEFVLPSFKVELLSEEMYYLISKEAFEFKISARHTYGEPVNGMAYVRYAIIDGEEKTYLRGLEEQLQIKQGEAIFSLQSQRILEKLKHLESMDKLVGHRLSVAVTVFETSSGEMEELEVSTIKFVSSPYVIDLSRTSSYFTPQLSFRVLVRVTYPDGSPAGGVPVQLEGQEEKTRTHDDGQALLTVSPPSNTESFEIKVLAGDGKVRGQVSEAQKTIHIYRSKSKSYLHVTTPHNVLEPDRSFSADIRAVTAAGAGNIKYYYYLIINKGKVLQVGRIAKSQLTKLTLPLSLEMVPSFRLVLYYYINVGGKTEMVANSAWIDVKDVCEAEITIQDMLEDYLPGSSTELNIQMGDNGKVCLAVVDSAIYILNNKNKLTQNKVFEQMNAYDLGCTFGGGADSVHVFMDAGLTFLSSVDTSKLRDGYSCKTDSKRTKRSLEIQAQYMGKLSHYTNSKEQKCCLDGISLIPMKRSCEERAKRVKEEDCRRAFLDCCEYAVALRKNQSSTTDVVGRTSGSEEDDFFDETQVRIRSLFPHSWLWRTSQGMVKGNNRVRIDIPDSITTWEIQAVGLFENKGFCVAEPKPLKVFRKVFISLRLPYSVKRNEQLEVRAILYNYLDTPLELKVYMKPVDVLCSPATGDKNVRKVTVKANSGYPIYFSVVPLAIGNIPITIIAYNNDLFINDAVTKILKVLGEGVMKTEEKSVLVNPKVRSSYQIFEELPTNMVPDTDSYLYIRARGEVLGETVDNSLNPDGINQLIKKPHGCAEQTSIYMAPTVFAVNYLDKSEQWLSLKAERKDEALQQVEMGYKRILEFKKPDGSYGAWIHTPSSNWLTAFVAKILSIVRTQIAVRSEHIQESALYLVRGQDDTGYFKEPHPVYHREMQGGVGGVEFKISLTSFITIALEQSLPSFMDNPDGKREVEDGIRKAAKYLFGEVEDIKRPYVLAITSYALALVNPTSSEAIVAFAMLKELETYDKETDSRYWKVDPKVLTMKETKINRVPQASAMEVETTAYALLAAVRMEELHYANAIVKWLTEQRNYGGGFRSTQDTVVALEALSAYSIATFQPQEIDMQFTFSSPGRSGKKILKLQRSNALIQDELKFPLGDNINIELSGSGNGTLTILKTYQVLEETSNTCGHLRLEVSVRGKVEYAAQDDYLDYGDYGEGLAADQPVSGIGWYDLRSRRRRQAPAADNAEVLYYEICFWHVADGANGQEPSGMAIVDISLLSGFEPDDTELQKLSQLADRYIDHYESKDGRVLLYLNSVTKDKECVAFGAKQIIPIGLIQPASATLYDYYNPSSSCTVFYNAPEQSTVVSKLCQNEVCECAEGRCPRAMRTFSKDVEGNARKDFACYSPIIDYAYIVTVSSAKVTGAFNVYTVSISRVIKVLTDELIAASAQRNFLKRLSCQLELRIGETYLLMGKDGKTKDSNRNMQYILDAESWIEAVPPQEKCKASRYRRNCEDFHRFISDLELEGCQT